MSSSRCLVIYTISFVDQSVLSAGTISEDAKVYMTWTNTEGHVYNLTCPIDGWRFRCPSLPKNDQDSVLFGELFIGANFTTIALALQNNTSLKDGVQHPEFLLISLKVYGHILENAFPLNRNVQLRATLAMTHRQTLKNNGIAALGFQKVGCDAQKIFSAPLIVCPV